MKRLFFYYLRYPHDIRMKYCGCGWGCGCPNSCGYPRMRIRMRSSDTPLAIICTRSTGTFPLAFSQERPLPNSRCHGARDDTKTYVCIYIDGVCVRWMPDSMQRCHVWRLQSATSSCMTCGFSQRTPHRVRRCQIWLLQCCPVLWLQRCQTAGINVVNSPV